MHFQWTGEIAFGLLSIPIKLASAVREDASPFVLLHKACSTKIVRVTRCPSCDVDLAWSEVGRGIEVSKGKHVLLPEQEGEPAEESRDTTAVRDDRKLQILRVLPRAFDPVFIDKSYWMLPASLDLRGYQLLYQTLEAKKQAAFVRIQWQKRSTPRPAFVLPRPSATRFTLHTLHPKETVATDDLPDMRWPDPPSAKEKRLARKLADEMFGDFDPKDLSTPTEDKSLKSTLYGNAEPIESALARSFTQHHVKKHPSKKG
jgi:DNA end-binding protein Ku